MHVYWKSIEWKCVLLVEKNKRVGAFQFYSSSFSIQITCLHQRMRKNFTARSHVRLMFLKESKSNTVLALRHRRNSINIYRFSASWLFIWLFDVLGSPPKKKKKPLLVNLLLGTWSENHPSRTAEFHYLESVPNDIVFDFALPILNSCEFQHVNQDCNHLEISNL